MTISLPEPPAGTFTTTVTSIGATVPLASGTSPVTVANEEDAQALRTGTSVSITQSMQMFNGNIGGNKNETNLNNVYHIYGLKPNYLTHRSSADLPTLRVNSTRSPEKVLRENTQSQPEQEYMRAGSILATSENGLTTGVQSGITAPPKVQREVSTCEDHPPSCSSPYTQGKEDQRATSAVDVPQTSKSG
ncbi:hypothetical protein K435DRAFT_868196 [Dendrothele bispora CBS 962.96]|uniref:Uncharacterized protein n=1 Tax=Dendrothele bispora (strain CBS 962.96) TaxID=1314807 RepID=A0A4V4HDD8_DENBC|nr:hypothetical protein K435DRAFT_868196 [Dendrothele bispora CBS 962.96]